MPPSKRCKRPCTTNSRDLSPIVSVTYSAEAIEGNDDILTKILLCLPAKPVFQFKLVSKRWNSLLSDPYFSTHWKPNSVSGLVLKRFWRKDNCSPKYHYISLHGSSFMKQKPKATLTSFDYIEDPSGIRVVNSCGGLFICASRSEGKNCKYYVCNPTTKQFYALPSPNDLNGYADVLGAYLTFDPSKSLQYKVLLVGIFGANRDLNILIYSTETTSWRQCKGTYTYTFDLVFSSGVYLNGSIHWPSERTDTSLYYNVDEECFNPLPMPPIPNGCLIRGLKYFGEANARLHLIMLFKSQYGVFELETDYSKWLLKCRVDLNTITRTFPVTNRKIAVQQSVLCVLGQKEVHELSLILYVSGQIISYNLKDGTHKKICDLNLRPSDAVELSRKGWCLVHQVLENPYLLQGI